MADSPLARRLPLSEDAEWRASVDARLDALERRQATRGPGPRDDADRRLLLAIATAALGLPFAARQVIRHARVEPDLAAALLAADIDNPWQLGKLLARLDGLDVNGVTVGRVRTVRGALRWRCAQASQGSQG